MSTTVEINSTYKAAAQAITAEPWTAEWSAQMDVISAKSREAFGVEKSEREAAAKVAEREAAVESAPEAVASSTSAAPAPKSTTVVKSKVKPAVDHNRTCKDCGKTFVTKPQRGRPPVKCESCRVVK